MAERGKKIADEERSLQSHRQRQQSPFIKITCWLCSNARAVIQASGGCRQTQEKSDPKNRTQQKESGLETRRLSIQLN